MGSDRTDGPPPDALLAAMAGARRPPSTKWRRWSTSRIGALLDRLATAIRIHNKAPADGGPIENEAPATLECSSCGPAAEAEFRHPVVAAAPSTQGCGADLSVPRPGRHGDASVGSRAQRAPTFFGATGLTRTE